MNDGRKKWEMSISPPPKKKSNHHQININLNFFDKIIQGQKI